MMDPTILNNQATVHIKNAKYVEAIILLTDALKIMKEVIPTGAENRQAHHMEDDACLEFISTEGAPSFVLPERDCDCDSLDCQHSVFRDPAYVISLDLYMHQETLSFVLLYNLALAYHLRGVKEKLLRKVYLSTAVSLYEHAHAMLTIDEGMDLSSLHVMAIASNLGHVHALLGHKKRADICFQHLLSVILYVVDCGEGTSKELKLDGFFCNIMPLIATKTTAAAA
jgi:hypothetical protein